ncbi:MAG: hypothetical protein ACJAR2_000990 [Ilumatobacter sp.]
MGPGSDFSEEPALERANCFFGGFALGDFAVEAGAADVVVSELRDRDAPSSAAGYLAD